MRPRILLPLAAALALACAGVASADSLVSKGSIKTAGKPGLNKQRFMGRIAKRTLLPGRYTLVVTASPVDGGAAETSTAPFKLVR